MGAAEFPAASVARSSSVARTVPFLNSLRAAVFVRSKKT